MKDNKNEFRLKDFLIILIFLLILIATNTFFISLELGRLNKNLEKNYTSNQTASAISLIDVTPYDTITDLTGTSWEIKDNITANAGYGQFDINFYDSNQDYSSLYIGYSIGAHATFVTMSGSVVDSNWNTFATDGEWIYPTTISITGGTDATNSDLITWLQANATQIQSGYSSTINLTNCTCNKSSESGLSGSYTAIITANTGYVLTSVNSSLGTITYSNNNKVATITISDVNDDFTISATASLIYHTISYNLGNVVVTSSKPMQIDEISTISITFQPYNNYVLPQYINVEGVTSYQWNYETGVLSLTNAFDNVEISINAEYKSGQYTFVELVDSVTLVPVNTFFNLFDFEIFGVNIYNLLLSSLILFVIIKIILKVFK